ncbi:hypothetical protein B1H10_03340 [candidate division KSB1 bacterium 4484_188]|nr:MAG: hypothetical protein B1H10_03340 [candidate division KSB1 bacterium 4484_188]
MNQSPGRDDRKNTPANESGSTAGGKIFCLKPENRNRMDFRVSEFSRLEFGFWELGFICLPADAVRQDIWDLWFVISCPVSTFFLSSLRDS